MRVQPADVRGARAHGCSEIRHAKVQRFKTAAELGDCFHIGHAKRCFDQGLQTHAGGIALALFDLVDHGFHHVQIARHPDLGHQQRVNLIAGLLHHIHHVAVHVMRVQAVDPHRNSLALAAPIDVIQRLNGVLAGLHLFRRRNGVFQIKENVIRRAIGCLVDHRGV